MSSVSQGAPCWRRSCRARPIPRAAVLVIVLILFGANRLPQLARSLGSSLKEFKKGIDEAQSKEASISPPSPDRGTSTSGERRGGYCKSPLGPDWTHCPVRDG